MNLEIKIDHYDFKILIDGLIHVHILRKEYVGFQSWMDKNGKYVIEFNTKTTSIKTEQDSKEKWLQILTALNEAI